MSWEVVIGLEIHVQLATGHKLFCRDPAVFGAEPNAHVCPVCLGLPGALPVPDPEAVRLALRAAAALGCTLHPTSVWERKNYFYPDLPKGYQITQLERPLATDGSVDTDAATVRIRRVHMEEDAGKSLHDRLPGRTAVDLNRAGTPLVEIVTEPDLRAPDQTRDFLQELERILAYAEVSDCNMEEGSLRVDANVSVRPAGSSELRAKTEIKNVNSFSHIEKAITLEAGRQREIAESGGEVASETLLWDERSATLRPMRSKEESQDYRYFPEPDLPPLRLDAADLARARAEVPELPRPRRVRFADALGLPAYDAEVLTQERGVADFFEHAVTAGADPKQAANWVMGPLQALRKERAEDVLERVGPGGLAELLALLADGTLSSSAAKTVLEHLVEEGGERGSPRELAERLGLLQVRDDARIAAWVEAVVAEHPDEVARLRAGQERLVGYLVGRVMERSRGKADPRLVRDHLRAWADGS